MCSLRFENNFLIIEGVRFASISKKTQLSKLSFAFVSLALPLLLWGTHSPGGSGAVRGWGVNNLEDARHWIGLLKFNPSTGATISANTISALSIRQLSPLPRLLFPIFANISLLYLHSSIPFLSLSVFCQS